MKDFVYFFFFSQIGIFIPGKMLVLLFDPPRCH